MSRVRPRKLNSFTFSMFVLLIWSVGAFTCLFGMWKSIYLDLFMFSDSLLISNHSFILPSSSLIKGTASMFSVFFLLYSVLEKVALST